MSRARLYHAPIRMGSCITAGCLRGNKKGPALSTISYI